ncbi:MAG TPA: glycosyltransferase family 2 protein [Acetobacteraceae bacterium]
MDTIVICAVLQDAAPGILEWIAFHRLVGVDRFVLYDLGSTDGGASVIARSRFGHQATVIDWARNDGQAAAYADFAANHASRFTWAAVIAQDEFIHPLDADTIRSSLPRYDGFSAVLLRRLTFATPHQQTRPGSIVIGNYTNRFPSDSPLNGASPTLLRTSDLRGAGDTPPSFVLAGEICNARGERVPAEGSEALACDDVMVVNRYPVRSTGNAVPAAPPAGADPSRQPRAAEAQATVADRRIARFIPRLRAMLHDASTVARPRPTQPPAAPAPAQAAAPLLLGIGIVTYNRRMVLSETLDHVLLHTRHTRTVLAVADDGSTDGTLDMLRSRQVLTVTGRNMGVAWNKNRALFLLSELSRCDVVVLLEDDAYPAQDNWEVEWMNAAIRWGHANVAAQWLRGHFVSGTGTAEDPILSTRVTAQCAVFSREALLFGGYFDSRFHGYGHEHVEHSRRLIRMGYGGVDQQDALFNLLWGGISYHSTQSSFDGKPEQVEENRQLARELFWDVSYRAPWRTEAEAKQFRDEMRGSFPRAVL